MVKEAQARFENGRKIKSVVEIQKQVQRKSTRNLKRTLPLKQEREVAKKVCRDAKREDVKTLVGEQDLEKSQLMPRERIRLGLKEKKDKEQIN